MSISKLGPISVIDTTRSGNEGYINAPIDDVSESVTNTITGIDTHSGAMDLAGTTALGQATQAITDLATVKFTPVDYEFKIPKFDDSDSGEQAPTFTAGNVDAVSYIDNDVFTPPAFQTDTKTDTYDKYTIPDLQKVPDVTNTPDIGAPTIPVDTPIKEPNTGDVTEFTDFIEVTTSIEAPTLKEHSDIDKDFASVPEYTFPDIDAAIPELNSYLENTKVAYDNMLDDLMIPTSSYVDDIDTNFDDVSNFEFVGYVTELQLRQAMAASTGSVWERKGFSQIDAQSQETNVKNAIALLELGEALDLKVAESLWEELFYRQYRELRVGNELKTKYKTLVETPLAQLDIIISEAYSSLFKDTNAAVQNMYNAQIAGFKLEADEYINSMRKIVASFEEWKSKESATAIEGKIASQKASIYSAEQEAKMTKANLYSSEVDALKSELELYDSKMNIFIAKAKAARAKLKVYESSTATYQAEVEDYKAKFKTYSLRTKATQANNRVKVAKTGLDRAKISAANADHKKDTVNMLKEAAKLKLSAIEQGSSFITDKFHNNIQAANASIQAQLSEQEILNELAASTGDKIENDLVVSTAKTKMDYLERASKAMNRAADKSLRANTAISQAAAVAQESAASSASSLTTGAYSAVSLGASLTGKATESASEGKSLGETTSFSDTINFSESYTTKVGK